MVRQPTSARTSSGQKRGSRHVEVHGLPSDSTSDELKIFFSTFGRVQKVVRQEDGLVVVSFTDRLSAMKATSTELRFEGSLLNLVFQEAKSTLNASTPPVIQLSDSDSSPTPVNNKTESTHAIPFNPSANTINTKRQITTNGTAIENSSTGHSTGGLQGIQLSNLPSASCDATLRFQINNVLSASRARSKLIDISFEQVGDAKKCLLLLQNISDINILLTDLNHTTLPSMLAGQRLKARVASHVAVTEAHNAYLATTAGVISAAPTASAQVSTIQSEAPLPPPDPCHKDANRTLYVGNLERRIKEDTLRARFSRFGVVLEVDIKNRDSHSPFAFLQFTDIESVANAIHTFQSNCCSQKGEKLKCKVNWGKPQATTKLWIGALPRSCSHEFLFSRLRNVAPDGIQEVIYDATNNEALVIFRSIEQAQMVHTKIKSRLFVIPPEKPQKDSQSPIQQVDFASDKLHDFFEDRKFGRIRVSDLLNTNGSSPLTPTSNQSATSARRTQQSAPSLRRTSSRASIENSNRRSETASPPIVGSSNAPESAAATAQPISRSESVEVTVAENLLAPPPDPPTDLCSSTPDFFVESGDPVPMSSRHNRRSGSRRSSPDTLRREHRRSRDYYEDRQRRQRSDSRGGYSSRYRDSRYHERSGRRSSDIRHRRRSPSSSSGSSTSSVATSSSRTRSSSASSHDSITILRSNVRSPLGDRSTEDLVTGQALAQREFSLSGARSSTSHAPLVRSDAVDHVRPSSSSNGEPISPDSMNRVAHSSSRSMREMSGSATSTPRSLNAISRLDFRDDSPLVLPRYRENCSRAQCNVSELEGVAPPDPRVNNENYTMISNLDDHPLICFPSFYLDDERGKSFCHRIHSSLSPSISRRTSQPGISTSRRPTDSMDAHRSHPTISRTTSSGSVDGKPNDVNSTEDSILHPLSFPFPPPPLGTVIESTEVKLRSDHNLAPKSSSFNERLQLINSKVDSISGRISSTTSGPTMSFEESLQRIKMRTKNFSRPSSELNLNTTSSVTSPCPTVDGTKPSSRLTINIPPMSSAASTPNVASPAFAPFPPNLHQPPPPIASPAASLSGNSSRSMSFTQAVPMTIETSPSVIGLAPRSASYAFTPSPAAPLPLPPQPPQLQNTTSVPQSPSVLSPKTTSIPPPSNHSKASSNLLVSPNSANQSSPLVNTNFHHLRPSTSQSSTSHQSTVSTSSSISAQLKPPGLHLGGSKSTVTSPLTVTTPSTPKSASSNRDESKDTSIIESAEEAKRKKEEKMKLFQSIRVPKKPRDANPTPEVFSFSSPLSRGPATTQQSTVHTPTTANPLRKPLEKPVLKIVQSNALINKSASLSTPTSNGPTTNEKPLKSRDEREKQMDKHKLSKTMIAPVIKSDAAKLAAFMEKEHRLSASGIEQLMVKVKEKALRKFPTDKEQREKYVREKHERLKQRETIRLRQREEEKRKQLESKQIENRKKSSEKFTNSQKPTEKMIKEREKDSKEKHRDKERDKDRNREKEHSAEKERAKLKLEKVARKKRQRTPSESGSDDESEDNSSEILAECGLRNIDLEMQRILFEEAKTGQLNLSMYERVKRKRMTTTQSEENRKSQALEKLRKGEKKKKTKRVRLSSDENSDTPSTTKATGKSSTGGRSGSDADSDGGETSDDGASISSSAKQKKITIKSELQKKAEKVVAKAKKLEKTEKMAHQKNKKPRKDTAGSTEDSETDRSKTQKSKKDLAESSSDETDDTLLVKKLQKNLSNYNDSDNISADESETQRKAKKKKSKAKKVSAFLADDDFCANSDEDSQSGPKRPTDSMKSDQPKTLHEKVGRAREKSRSSDLAVMRREKPERSEKPKQNKSAKDDKSREAREHKEPKEGRPLKSKDQKEARKSVESAQSTAEAEPQKKKLKLSISKTELTEGSDSFSESKKRRRSTDGEVDESTKRAKSTIETSIKSEDLSSPLHIHTASSATDQSSLLATKVSPTIREFAPISPTPSTTSDSVRLENFVTQNCQSRNETPLISPLVQRHDSTIKENTFQRSVSTEKTEPVVSGPHNLSFKRQRTSSSSSSSSSTASSSTSVESFSTSATSAVDQRDVSASSPSTVAAKFAAFQFVRALDEDAAKTSSVSDVQSTTTTSVINEKATIMRNEKQTMPLKAPSALSPSRLMEELQFDDSSSSPKPAAKATVDSISHKPISKETRADEEDDDEVDYEEMLVSELNRKEPLSFAELAPSVAVEETFPPQCSQETEDAVESITAIMANKGARSDDEEDESFPLAHITRERISRSSSHGTNGTSEVQTKSEEPLVLPMATTTVENSMVVDTPITQSASIELNLCPSASEPVPSSSPTDIPTSVATVSSNGRISPISSTVESVARDAPLTSNETLVQPPIQVSAIVSTTSTSHIQNVASSIAHLPTPPPSRSSGGSPQYTAQLQYTVGQRSPSETKPVVSSIQTTIPTTTIDTTKKCEPQISTAALLPPSVSQAQMANDQFSQLISPRPTAMSPPAVSLATQYQQQMLTAQQQRGLIEMMQRQAAGQIPATSADVSAMVAMQQRARAGSQSAASTPNQRKTGASATAAITTSVPTVSLPNTNSQRTNAAPNSAQLPTSTLQAMGQDGISNNDRLATVLTSLTASVNQPMNSTLLQKLITSRELVAQYPELAQLAAHPQAVEYLALHFRNVQQQHMLQMQQEQVQQAREMENQFPPNSMAHIAQLLNMAGPNANSDVLRLLAMQRQQQEEVQRQQLLQRQNEERQLQRQQEEQRQQLAHYQAIYQQQFLPTLQQQQQLAQVAQLQANNQLSSGLPNAIPTVPPTIVQATTPKIPQILPTSIPNAEQSQHRLDVMRYPICWQGNLALKSNGTQVQMHHISGNQLLMESTAKELAVPADDGRPTIRITQRMRLQNPHLITVCNKMNNEDEFVAMICFPCGKDAEQVNQQTTKMTSTFISYLSAKMAAGVVTRAPNYPHPSCVAHVFPPCEFSNQQLQRLAPAIFEEISRLHSAYLFVVVTRSDGVLVEDHVEDAKLPLVSNDTPKYAS
ncbi:hypothetical protein M3Y96_01077900 [Aphelenchoides besseyi]|nr:hypothetical protein M3Y96_01077900 [Aphelenchoides besseyi]